MSNGTGLAEALLGLPGFRVLEVVEDPTEVVIWVETGAGGGARFVWGDSPAR